MERKKSIMLLITYQCNLHCSYCYEPKVDTKQMSIVQAKQILLKQFAKLGKEYNSIEVHFMGGEPLMEYLLMHDISEWLWSLDLKIRLSTLFASTNGTLLTSEMKAWFAQNSDRICLGLSFDGDETMQNLNRSASFSKVDLDFFSRTWPRQSVKMTISPTTVTRFFEGAMYLRKRGFKHLSADLAMGNNIHWTKEDLQIFRQQLGHFVEHYAKNPDEERISMFCIDPTRLLRPTTYAPKTCNCGEDLVCIDCNGSEYACHLFSPIALPIDKALRTKRDVNFHDHTLFVQGKCGTCTLNSVCNHCYGMNNICTGNITEADPAHCSAFKLIFTANCRLALLLAERQGATQRIKEIQKIIRLLT